MDEEAVGSYTILTGPDWYQVMREGWEVGGPLASRLAAHGRILLDLDERAREVEEDRAAVHAVVRAGGQL